MQEGSGGFVIDYGHKKVYSALVVGEVNQSKDCCYNLNKEVNLAGLARLSIDYDQI